MKQIRYTKRKTSMWIFFHYNKFADDVEWIHLPAELKSEWVDMPVEFSDDLTNDEIFGKLNIDSNPLSSQENQDWIRDSECAHTSMSIGDCIEDNDGTLWVCHSDGWAKIAWVDERHGVLVSLSSDSLKHTDDYEAKKRAIEEALIHEEEERNQEQIVESLDLDVINNTLTCHKCSRVFMPRGDTADAIEANGLLFDKHMETCTAPEPTKKCSCGAKAEYICDCGNLLCGEDQCPDNCGGGVNPLKGDEQ